MVDLELHEGTCRPPELDYKGFLGDNGHWTTIIFNSGISPWIETSVQEFNFFLQIYIIIYINGE